MTSSSIRLRRAATIAAAAAVTALAGAPSGALATAGHPSAATHHASIPVRHYDSWLLSRTNKARTHRGRSKLSMNTKLWKVAHAYAEHLAKSGTLVHNPHLVTAVTKACPHWTALGENIGYEVGTKPSALFQGYWHSPPHKANLLDRSYREAGVASVQVKRGGHYVQWNVMDFANGCG